MSTNTQKYIWQSVIIDITIPDHFTIYCSRKIPKTKYSKHKEITFYSLKITQVMPIWFAKVPIPITIASVILMLPTVVFFN